MKSAVNTHYRKISKLLPLAAVSLFLINAPLRAGDAFVGIRTWQAAWQPGILQSIKEHTTQRTIWQTLQGDSSIEYVSDSAENISGFYSGPLFTYITSDRKWSFGLVGLFGNSGNQNYSLVSYGEDTNHGNFTEHSIRTNISAPERQDIDFTASYGITHRVKVFLGFRHQKYEYSITPFLSGGRSGIVDISGAPEYSSGNVYGTGNSELVNSYAGPALGFAYSHPFGEHSSLALSLGIFRAKGSSNLNTMLAASSQVRGSNHSRSITNFNLSNRENDLKMSGATLELGFTTRVTGSIFLQVGYRGQFSTLDLDFAMSRKLNYSSVSGVRFRFAPNPADEYTDRFHGFSFSVIYKI